MGLATLRMPLLPTETPPDRREMVLMAGRASYMMATRNTAAAGQGVPGARRRGIPKRRTCTTPTASSCCRSRRTRRSRSSSASSSCSPAHAWSLMQIAFEYLKRGDAADGAAVGAAGGRGGAERVPGAQGARAGAARHRRRRGRDSRAADRHQARAREPGLHFTLGARLSARRTSGGRRPREREEFTRLDRLARTQRSGAQSVGGIKDK